MATVPLRRNTMAGKIHRTSGPQPLREGKAGEFTWTIPVSGVPSREWMALFNAPLVPDEVFMPSRVDFHDRGLVFVATEQRVQQWMQHIDEWIAAANEGVVDAEARRVDAAEREERGSEAAKQRVANADKYRSL
jgi:hypothetical protein